MNLDQLTPAPWDEDPEIFAPQCGRADVDFIILARDAFDGDPAALKWWEENRRKREAAKECTDVEQPL